MNIFRNGQMMYRKLFYFIGAILIGISSIASARADIADHRTFSDAINIPTWRDEFILRAALLAANERRMGDKESYLEKVLKSLDQRGFLSVVARISTNDAKTQPARFRVSIGSDEPSKTGPQLLMKLTNAGNPDGENWIEIIEAKPTEIRTYDSTIAASHFHYSKDFKMSESYGRSALSTFIVPVVLGKYLNQFAGVVEIPNRTQILERLIKATISSSLSATSSYEYAPSTLQSDTMSAGSGNSRFKLNRYFSGPTCERIIFKIAG